MLILVAVTINVIVNSGLFKHAQDATTKWADEQRREQDISSGNIQIAVGDKTYNSMDEYLNEQTLTTDRSNLKVGDYVAYTPDTVPTPYSLASEVSGYDTDQSIYQVTALQWRVLNINEDGSVDLVSADAVSRLYLQGALGYNNGVTVLNDICEEQYSNESLGVTGRSIKIEDIENKYSSKAMTDKVACINNTVSNASEGTYTQSVDITNNTATFATTVSQYPDIYQYENGSGINTTTVKTDGIGGSETYSGYTNGITTNTSENANTSGLTVTQTCYFFDNTTASYFTDSTFNDLVFGANKSFFLASRCVDCRNGEIYFGICRVYTSKLLADALFFSSLYPGNVASVLRPVVSLGSNIKISTTGGTAENPRSISL